MHRNFALLVFVAASSSAGEPSLAPETALLASVRSRMAAILRSQPNYTCVQEIERASRHARRGRFEIVDMLRLEVALVDGKEMFAWPGSRKFDEVDLRDMVAHGAIGNGNFALHARSVFTGGGPQFSYAGEDKVRDRRAIRFDYRVPLLASGYHLRVNTTEAVVGYHGSVWADPDTLDVMRLDVVADDIPPALGLTEAQDSMEYARVKIGEGDFLLPSASELHMIDATGSESRNRTRFAACRQYSGDSVISFAEPQPDPVEPATPAADPVAEPRSVPAELVSDVELQNDIDSSRSMVGDSIVATLSHPFKLRKQVIVPKGASLQGRISRLERRAGHFTLELRFTEATSGASRWKLLARIYEASIPPGLRSFERIEGLLPRNAPQIGTLYIKGNGVRLPRGVRFTVRTEDVPAGGAQ